MSALAPAPSRVLRPHPLPEPASALLIALLAIDAILIAGHLAFFFLEGWGDARLLLHYEPAGYGELFQYAKTFGLCAVLLACAVTSRRWRWAAWALLFGIMCLDDSLQLHERFGRFVRTSALGLDGEKAQAPRLLGIRWQDLMEMSVAATLGFLPLLLIGIACVRSSGDLLFRRMSRQLAAGLVALIICGLALDALHEHALIQPHRWLVHALGIADDGGEMIIISLMIWIVARTLSAGEARAGAQH